MPAKKKSKAVKKKASSAKTKVTKKVAKKVTKKAAPATKKKTAKKAVKKAVKRAAKKTTKKKKAEPKPTTPVVHELVPDHVLLTKEETEKVLEEYDILLHRLPKILIEDPAIRHLEVKVDDVILIKRTSFTAGEVKFYRRVALE